MAGPLPDQQNLASYKLVHELVPKLTVSFAGVRKYTIHPSAELYDILISNYVMSMALRASSIISKGDGIFMPFSFSKDFG